MEQIQFKDLKVIDIIYLASFMRTCLSKNKIYFIPLIDAPFKMSPNSNFDNYILTHLINNNLIVSKENRIYEEDLPYLPFQLNVINSVIITRELFDLIMIKVDESSTELKDFIYLNKELYLQEGLVYLEKLLNDYNMGVKEFGKNVHLAFEEVLKSYSINQLYYFIWSSVRDIAAYKQKKTITNRHAVNIIPKTILSKLRLAIEAKWKIPQFDRLDQHRNSNIRLLIDELLIDKNIIYE